jgi:hypothetical protein
MNSIDRQRPSEHDQQQNDHKHERNCEKDVDDAHHHVIDAPADIARYRTIKRAHDNRNNRADDADDQADAGALGGAGKQITAQIIHAKVMTVCHGRLALQRRIAHKAPVNFLIGPGRDALAKQRKEADEHQHDHPHNRPIGNGP